MDFQNYSRGSESRLGAFRDAATARTGRCVLVGLVVMLVVGSGGCGQSPEEQKAAAAEHKAQTTGRLVVKSNHANTTVEATRIPSGSEASPTRVNGVADGALEHTLSSLPPGECYPSRAHRGRP